METECSHDWSDDLETCRNCDGTAIEETEINTAPAVGSGGLRAETEPLYGYFCEECKDFTMVSLARHCALCGEVDWLTTMDEELFGD